MNYKFIGINNSLIVFEDLENFHFDFNAICSPNFVGKLQDTILFFNKNNEIHREDGPAIIWPSGNQFWYKEGKLHREDGPARIWPDGAQYWYKNDKRHREDGPAVIWANGEKFWYLNGVSYNSHDYFDKLVGPPYNKSPEEIKRIKAQLWK